MNPPDPLTPKVSIPIRIDAATLPSLSRAGLDQIVKIGDQTGIFTPITGKDVANSDANLEKIVDAMRAELASVRVDNAALQAKLDALAEPPRSSDDLAEGVQHALDGLAERLGTMSNATSNFAVREFTLESKVHVDVTPLGTIGFQFVRPGEQVNAAALSTVSLTVVPVPKPAADPGTPVAPTPLDAPLEAIDGLTPDQAGRLRAAHVSTAGEFARVATRANLSAQLVSMLGVDREALGRLTLIAGLLGIPGIDRRQAAVLYDAGVVDAATLAAPEPGEVVEKYSAAATKHPEAPLPTATDAAAWIAAARALMTR